jgi:hypothetical protein
MATKSKSKAPAQPKLSYPIRNRIRQLAEEHGIDAAIFQDFAHYVLEYRDPKPLSRKQLQTAIYEYFGVKNATALRKSPDFQMATEDIGKLNLSQIKSLEILYRRFIGILPNEYDQQGYGCINGINIFNYFKPWIVFDLNPKTATIDDIKKSYRKLSKIYHPDNSKTGNAEVFDRINTMYRSICAEA